MVAFRTEEYSLNKLEDKDFHPVSQQTCNEFQLVLLILNDLEIDTVLNELHIKQHKTFKADKSI